MPWTFAHPAAVLPFRGWSRAPLSLAGLMIGSMVPDLGYYVFQFQGTAFAHSLIGSITFCPLLGLLLWSFFRVLRRPLCYMLPQPHRQVLTPLANEPSQLNVANVSIVVLAIVIGAWTHLLWDSFTHVDRWFVVRIPWLQREVLSYRGHTLHGYSLLQYASSAAGVAALVWYYWRWLRGIGRTTHLQWFTLEDRWRYGCILGAAAVAALAALPWAFYAAATADGLFGLRVFVVRWLVGTTSSFLAAFSVLALICYWQRPRSRTTHRD